MQEHDAQEILKPDESEQIHIVKGTVPRKDSVRMILS